MTRNAERYLIRKLWSLEVGAFRRHLLRLDPETRQFRFGTAVNDNFLHAYADTARRTGTVIYGAFLGSELCASAELRALHVMGDELAEAAFVVETAHRHQGLGSALMNRIITAAQNRGIHQLHMICARENHPMQQLGRKFGANFTPGQPESTATAFSPGGEAMHDRADFVTAVLNWSRAN
jgi:GNAT superfamily N-acetyltransferase